MAYIGGQTMLSKRENNVYEGWNPVKAVINVVQALPVTKVAQLLPVSRVISAGSSGGSSGGSSAFKNITLPPQMQVRAPYTSQISSYLPSRSKQELKVTDIEAPGFDYSEMLRMQAMTLEEQEAYLQEKEKKEERLQGFGEYSDNEIDRVSLLRAGLLTFLLIGITALLLKK